MGCGGGQALLAEGRSCKGAKLKTIRVCTKDHCGLLFVAGQLC